MVEKTFKNKIGKELINLINNNASIIQMSRWADGVYSNYCRNLDSETEELITKISFMQHGPEFEISKDALEIIAHKLMENDPGQY